MKMALRVVAIAIAVAGVIDPVMSWRRRVPVAVELRLPDGSDPARPRALALREQIQSALQDRFRTDGGGEPAAIVAIGNAAVAAKPGVPVFALALDRASPHLEITNLRLPARTVLGQSAPVEAALRARGLEGASVMVTLEYQGVAQDQRENTVTAADQTSVVTLPLTVTAPGVHRIRITARAPGVSPVAADAVVTVEARALRVLVYEPRPSWPASFVRRSLESDPSFEVSAVSRTSRGVSTELGAPSRIADALAADVGAVIVGAPDELSASDVALLLEFVRTRGGRLVMLPDRKLPDALRRRLELPEFEEVLLEKPVPVDLQGNVVQASELLVAKDIRRSRVIGMADVGSGKRPVLVSVAHGEGEVIVSGLLDAWRFRGDPRTSDTAWRALIADAVLQAPAPVGVTLQPALARTGEAVVVTVAVRQTEFGREAGVTVPPVQASLSDAAGHQEMIRLWPSARTGVFTGTVRPPRAGSFTVTALAGSRSASAILTVADDVVHASADRSAQSAFVAQVSGGGVAADVADLRKRLEAVAPAEADTRVRPMRSGWWLLPFTAALLGEWALRRREGLR